jgi:histidine phosphotransferase ChpT
MKINHSIPTRATEILISKLCHDLVSPVGAVNNGIEFLTDMGADGLKDGLGLIEHSAHQASVRLQLFRMCYGAGGSDAKVSGKMIYETFQNYIEGTKIKLNWDLMNAMPDSDLPSGFMKTLLNAMVFVQESLPKGGEITITLENNHMTIIGRGGLIRPKEGSIEAIEGKLSIDDITPKSVHGFITIAYADLFELELRLSQTDEALSLRLDIP